MQFHCVSAWISPYIIRTILVSAMVSTPCRNVTDIYRWWNTYNKYIFQHQSRCFFECVFYFSATNSIDVSVKLHFFYSVFMLIFLYASHLPVPFDLDFDDVLLVLILCHHHHFVAVIVIAYILFLCPFFILHLDFILRYS